VEPVAADRARPVGKPLGSFTDIVPMNTQIDTRSRVFTNGIGDGQLVLSHTSLAAQIVFIVLAGLGGAAAVIFLSRAFRPFRAGGALAVVALLFLAFAGPGWIPFWNGALAGVVLATLVVLITEKRRARA